MFKTIIFKKEERIATIILNRPEKLNAHNEEMVNELGEAIKDIAEDGEVRVALITGAGRAFCVGADFRFSEVREGKLSAQSAEDMKSFLIRQEQGYLPLEFGAKIILSLQRLDKPTIAVINGDAAGGGLDIALACDMRFGSEKARFSVGYTRIGIPPDNGTTWLLPRIVGMGKALELIFTGDICSAEEAYRIGLLNKLVPHENLEKESLALAQRLAQGPPIANRLAKQLVYKGLETVLETALCSAGAYAAIAVKSQDHLEGIRAFAEKRPPKFTGK